MNNPLLAALNAGLDAVYRALEREAPVVKEGAEAPECDTCAGEGVLWIGYNKYTCPTCDGKGTTWKTN